MFIAGNIKQLGTWQPKGLKLDRTEANVFEADFSVPVGTRMQFKVTRGSWQTVEKDKLGQDFRIDEYTLTKDKRLEAGGKGLDYIRFMTEELKPFIDRTYRTKTDRSSTYIGGSSHGGLIAMHACLQEPEVFDCCLAFSSTLGWDNERLLTSFQSEVKWPADVRLWFSMGTREGRDAEAQKLNLMRAQRLHKLLAPTNSKTNTAIQIQFQEFADATHDEKSWAAQFPVALKAVMAEHE